MYRAQKPAFLYGQKDIPFHLVYYLEYQICPENRYDWLKITTILPLSVVEYTSASSPKKVNSKLGFKNICIHIYNVNKTNNGSYD